MRMLSVLPGLLAFALLVSPGTSGEIQKDAGSISENEVRGASARLYLDILMRACRNGWRYPRSQIENGFKRHFEETKLQLISQGYRITSDVTAGKAIRPCSGLLVVAHGPERASPPFECSRPYWLGE